MYIVLKYDRDVEKIKLAPYAPLGLGDVLFIKRFFSHHLIKIKYVIKS